MQRRDFTLNDFMGQMGQITRLGPMSKVIGMIPGMSEVTKQVGGDTAVERQIVKMRAIYDSMNTNERVKPEILDGDRRGRVAKGAGVHFAEVHQFLKQFEMTRQMMANFGRVQPMQLPNIVAGLVTDEPRRRDPSWVFEPMFRVNWRDLLAIAILIVAFAILIASVLR